MRACRWKCVVNSWRIPREASSFHAFPNCWLGSAVALSSIFGQSEELNHVKQRAVQTDGGENQGRANQSNVHHDQQKRLTTTNSTNRGNSSLWLPVAGNTRQKHQHLPASVPLASAATGGVAAERGSPNMEHCRSGSWCTSVRPQHVCVPLEPFAGNCREPFLRL